MNDMNLDTYTIEQIAEDCFDLYVSEDGGYTWDFFDSYVTYDQARDDAELALARANREDFYTL